MQDLSTTLTPYYSTNNGSTYLGDSLEMMKQIDASSIDLICTSPPFALLRKKSYGNVEAEEYVEWFLEFAREFKRILKPEGSLVIDIGGTWIKGQPVRSLYHYELVLRLCKSEKDGGCGLNLAQELFWYNPAKLPTPAEWVTIRRVRVKDAVNTIWWLSPTTNPKASNRRVLKPYSDSQIKLMKNGYKAKLRPSEHQISTKFNNDNGGAIPSTLVASSEFESRIGEPVNVVPDYENEIGEPVNLVAASNTSSMDIYQRRCREEGIKPHPARFPHALPEFIINLCTEEGDVVLDPFAGSNTTGEVAERLNRKWIAFELNEDYLLGSKFRFPELDSKQNKIKLVNEHEDKNGKALDINQQNLFSLTTNAK
jgi:site-specific DNA-methyltransferase (cytosine-N4-specific)